MPAFSLRSALVVSVLLAATPQAGYPQADTTRLTLPGLQAPVEIIRDKWGIAHIYAQNEPDLFFAQGYTAARDRLFQFEMWRRRATGTVAEILGPREVRRDMGARLFKFRGDLKAELAHYHPRGESIVSSFVRGVNAYIERTHREPALLPLEFKMLGIRPGLWTPEIVISRHQGLVGNVGAELNIGRAVAALGPEAVKEIVYFEPEAPDLTLDPSITSAHLAKDILGLYTAFRSEIAFKPEDVAPEYRATTMTVGASDLLPTEYEMALSGEQLGSNNWVVSGALTSSGRPIMANDPHRIVAVPALRYLVHLVAPGWNVIGAGEPVLPGVSIGHNEHGAWGLTIFSNDSEDLLVYEVNPANRNQYRYRGAWEDMRVVREAIPVEGRAASEVTLKYTRHGPVVFEDTDLNKAYAVRAAWMDIGGAPYLASLRMDQAKSWEEFREACTYNHIPGENMVWADVHGNIGWQAVAVAPIRPNWSGMTPVPGDGRFEWAGYLPIAELPHIHNPPRGFWGNGNDYVVPDGYARRAALTPGGWADPYRGDRVREVLASGRPLTAADMMKLQHDALSIPARTLLPILLELEPTNARAGEALERLRGWDYILDRRSIAAGIYVEWERRLSANVRAVAIPPAVNLNLSMKRIVDWLLAPDGRFGADPIAGRNELMLRSVTEAVDNLTGKLGPDMGRWQYGQSAYKHAKLLHPLSPAVSTEIKARLEVGTLPRGGYQYTPLATGAVDNQSAGASVRIIAPVENWDLAVATQTPGQSGNSDDPHYRDLYPLWATGQYFPLFFSRLKVQGVAESVTVLTP